MSTPNPFPWVRLPDAPAPSTDAAARRGIDGAARALHAEATRAGSGLTLEQCRDRVVSARITSERKRG